MNSPGQLPVAHYAFMTLRQSRVEALKPFGGIRIEDDVLVRQDGCEDLTRKAFADL